MDTVILNSDMCLKALVIPKTVADRMINEANEAQLKIYMYLLVNEGQNITVADIADYFNYTEADVERAVKFWNRSSSAGRSTQAKSRSAASEDKKASGDKVVAFSMRPSYTKEKLAQFGRIPEVAQLILAAEQYIARPLKADDLSSLLYIYDEIGFDAELIEYLLEYCITNNKKSFRSMETVAEEWKEAGVKTLADARKYTRQVPKEMPQVLAALGLDSSSQPVDAQIAYVRKWTESFGFGMDIISEACKRTVITIGKADFRYANGILKGWHDKNVSNIADILRLDEEYRQKMVNEKLEGRDAENRATVGDTRKKSAGNSKKPEQGAPKSKFNNFNERQYDYDQLLKDAMSN